VPVSGALYSAPSSTPTCKHLPMSLNIDPSATRIWSISISLGTIQAIRNGTMFRLPESSSPCPVHHVVKNTEWHHGLFVRAGSRASIPRSPARKSPPAPRAGHPGPSCPRMPKSQSALSCPCPSGCGHVGWAGVDTASTPSAPCRSRRLSSTSARYCSLVTPSTPTAASFRMRW